MIGFIILVGGSLIHNEIVVIPMWGLDRYTKERRGEEKSTQECLLSSYEDVEKENVCTINTSTLGNSNRTEGNNCNSNWK